MHFILLSVTSLCAAAQAHWPGGIIMNEEFHTKKMCLLTDERTNGETEYSIPPYNSVVLGLLTYGKPP